MGHQRAQKKKKPCRRKGSKITNASLPSAGPTNLEPLDSVSASKTVRNAHARCALAARPAASCSSVGWLASCPRVWRTCGSRSDRSARKAVTCEEGCGASEASCEGRMRKGGEGNRGVSRPAGHVSWSVTRNWTPCASYLVAAQCQVLLEGTHVVLRCGEVGGQECRAGRVATSQRRRNSGGGTVQARG